MVKTFDISITQVQESRISELDFDHIEFAKIYSDHMFLADYRNGEWQNLRIQPYKNISLSPANPAIHYGQSIFEGLKAYKNDEGGVLVFRPTDNYHRMNESAERMVMPEIPEELFMEGLVELLKLDKAWVPSKEGTALYIRPFMFATDEFIGVKPSDTFTFMIITSPVGAYYSHPVKVKIEKHYTRAVKGGTGYAKTAGNYAASLYPALLAQKDGYDQLIWTDGQTHEYVEESGTMNLMFIINDMLVTAPTGDTILRGITRDSVLKLAQSWGVPVEERPISVVELIAAIEDGSLKEAFGVGTAATIAHIATIANDGVDYELPGDERWEFSNRVLATLDGIKTGRIEDKFGWNLEV
jgi:branched-chain amino acid aminotransferase